MERNPEYSDQLKDLVTSYEFAQSIGQQCYYDADDYLDISDYYINTGSPEKGLSVLRNSLELFPHNEMLQLSLAGLLIFLYNFDEAKQIIDRLVGCEENEYIYLSAQLKYALENDVLEAEKLFRNWLSAEEEDIRYECDEHEQIDRIRGNYVHILMSFIQLSENCDKQLLIEWVDEYISRFNPLGDYESDFIVGEICRDGQLYDQIEQIYTELLIADPYLKNGWSLMAAVQNYKGKFEDSITSADFAIAIDPDDTEALLTKAHSYYAMQEYEKGIPLFEKYINVTGDHSQSIYIGLKHLFDNEYEQGYKYLSQAKNYCLTNIKSKNVSPLLLFEMANAFIVCKHFDDANQMIDVAQLEGMPWLDCDILRATIELDLKNNENAKDIFNKVIANVEKLDKVKILINIAIRMISYDLLEDSIPLLRRVVLCKSYPEHVQAYAYLAYIYFRMLDITNFLKFLKKACCMCPQTAKMLFSDFFPEIEPQDYYAHMIKNKDLI